jgi:predicted N-acetyltransferase YhbS
MTRLRSTEIVPSAGDAAFVIRSERASDVSAREMLLDACFGANRNSRTCQRLREGRKPAEGLSFSAVRGQRLSQIRSSQWAPQDRERTSNLIRTTADLSFACRDSFGNSPEDACCEDTGNFRNATRLVGTLRLWPVSAGGTSALVLGPLAVEDACRKLGIGAALVDHALAAARARGHRAVILLGDAPYYARFGFLAQKASRLSLPGPFERDRLLGLELCDGALKDASGMIVSLGASLPKTTARATRRALRAVSRAA